jgi:CDP-glucose 4,6-dehydratase
MKKPELDPVILGEASYEIEAQYLDCTKARQALAWQPRYTLENGLRETIGWYEEYLE